MKIRGAESEAGHTYESFQEEKASSIREYGVVTFIGQLEDL